MAIIGAGIGGLAAAIDLARAGLRVTVLERAEAPGGKVRQAEVGGRTVDAGPTQLTMRTVFDRLFERAGSSLDDHLVLHRAQTLGRHVWAGGATLDLHADQDRTADAIAAFAGPADAAAYRTICRQARRMHDVLQRRFLERPRQDGMDFVLGAGPVGVFRLFPFRTLWEHLVQNFRDPRLHQVFGRFGTDHGASPFQAPAALLALAHAEQSGTWTIQGGMQRLIDAMIVLAAGLGAELRTGAGVAEIIVGAAGACGVRLESGETIEADAVVMNGEPSALATGLLGRGVVRAAPQARFPQRSLSATTWAAVAEVRGLDLARRTVCFSSDTRAEFELIGSGRLPTEPTTTIIAQDRMVAGARPEGPERLLLAVNAPASGDRRAFSQVEVDQCLQGMADLMERCGLVLGHAEPPAMAAPSTFHRLFPASGGALYGMALTGPASAFRRPGSRTRLPGLYLAGGTTHPGGGLALAALSGRHAATALVKDLGSRRGLARLLGKASPRPEVPA